MNKDQIIHFNDNKVIFETTKDSLPFVLMALKNKMFVNETIVVKSINPNLFQIHYLIENELNGSNEKIDIPTLKRYINWKNGYKDQEMTDVVYSLDLV